jgi:hypothetical protein
MAASGTCGPAVGVKVGARVAGMNVLVTVGVSVGGFAAWVAASIDRAVR